MKAIQFIFVALLCLSSNAQALTSSTPVHVVFVPGINSHRDLTINGPKKVEYFPYLAETFQKRFKNLQMEEVWHPFSWNISTSAKFLSSNISEAMESNREAKFVLVGHSKGAVEVLLTLLQNPQWIESGRIEKVILMQGAFNGSYLPDLIKRYMLNRKEFKYLAGLWSLEHGKPKEVLETQFDQYPQNLVNRLSERIYFIRSFKPSVEAPRPTRLLFQLLEKYGLNDGALLVEDQMVPKNLGNDLGVLNATHMDLIADRLYTTTTRAYKAEFSEGLFDRVFRNE